MKQNITQFSSYLDNAATNAIPVEQLSSANTFSIVDAYAIQKALVDLRIKRGEKLSGIKLGFTSKAKMEQMGVKDLIWGRLTDSMEVINNGYLDFKKFICPRAEPEIAFLLKKDVERNVSRDNISEYVSSIAAAIEIIDSRYKNFKFSLKDVIADNCFSSAYVLGDWKDFSIGSSNLNMTKKINGEIVQNGNSNAILGNPLNSLLEAFRIANQYGVSLKKNMVVLAGAATPAVFLKEEDKVVIEVDNLGIVCLNVI